MKPQLKPKRTGFSIMTIIGILAPMAAIGTGSVSGAVSVAFVGRAVSTVLRMGESLATERTDDLSRAEVNTYVADEVENPLAMIKETSLSPNSADETEEGDKSVVSQLLEEGFQDQKYKASKMLKNMVKNGELGVKTKKGFYDYSNGIKEKTVSERFN